MALYDYFNQKQYDNLESNVTPEIERQYKGIDISKYDYEYKAPEGLPSLSQSTTEHDVNVEKKGSTWGKIGSYVGAIGNAMPNASLPEGSKESTQKTYSSMNNVKDTVGKAIPMAGIFRGVEKLGVKAGGVVDGDRGKVMSQAFFSPSDTAVKLANEDDVSTGQAILGTLLPGYGGTLINKANEKRKKEALEIDRFKKKNDRELQYLAQKRLDRLNKEKSLKEYQLNYLSQIY